MGIYSNNPDYWRGRSSSSRSSSSGASASGGGVKFTVDEGVIELNVKNIERMMTNDPEMRRRLQAIIKTDMLQARQAVVKELPSVFDNGDPMQAYRAVRHVVYQAVLGGNLNILNMQRGTASWSYRQQARNDAGIGLITGRGGNRRKRSSKTARYQGYEGKARGFILRWVNSGMTKTRPRTIKFTTNPSRKVDKWNHNPNTGNRGFISSRNFFEPLASSALNVVSQHLAQMIEEEIAKQFNENQE